MSVQTLATLNESVEAIDIVFGHLNKLLIHCNFSKDALNTSCDTLDEEIQAKGLSDILGFFARLSGRLAHLQAKFKEVEFASDELRPLIAKTVQELYERYELQAVTAYAEEQGVTEEEARQVYLADKAESIRLCELRELETTV